MFVFANNSAMGIKNPHIFTALHRHLNGIETISALETKSGNKYYINTKNKDNQTINIITGVLLKVLYRYSHGYECRIYVKKTKRNIQNTLIKIDQSTNQLSTN